MIGSYTHWVDSLDLEYSILHMISGASFLSFPYRLVYSCESTHHSLHFSPVVVVVVVVRPILSLGSKVLVVTPSWLSTLVQSG